MFPDNTKWFLQTPKLLLHWSKHKQENAVWFDVAHERALKRKPAEQSACEALVNLIAERVPQPQRIRLASFPILSAAARRPAQQEMDAERHSLRAADLLDAELDGYAVVHEERVRIALGRRVEECGELLVPHVDSAVLCEHTSTVNNTWSSALVNHATHACTYLYARSTTEYWAQLIRTR